MRLAAALRRGWHTVRSRLPARDRPKAWLHPAEDALVPPRRLWIGPGDSIHHYYRWVWEYLAYLVLLCDLRRDSSVLELGCGHGRTARGLIDYLRSPGAYRGLDVDAVRIEDARRRIGSRYANFQFVHADVASAGYNPRGSIAASVFDFPFEDESFDVVYAASLFTHLLPEETARYFLEARRVLKPGGRCLFSFFLLDEYRGRGTTISARYEPEHPLLGQAGAAVADPEHPDALVAYGRAAVAEMAEQAGLHIQKVWPGLWCEAPGPALNEQDLVLLVRS